MQSAWTINAYADQEIVRFEKLTPLITEQRTIRLDCILERHPWTPVLVFVLDRASEEIEAHQGRFAALPGNCHLICAMGFNQLLNVLFEELIIHAKTAARIQLLLIQVEAVRAV
jgi:hypothetical protein